MIPFNYYTCPNIHKHLGEGLGLFQLSYRGIFSLAGLNEVSNDIAGAKALNLIVILLIMNKKNCFLLQRRNVGMTVFIEPLN